MDKTSMINLTGLWKSKRKDKNGNDFMHARLGPFVFFVFPNANKAHDEPEKPDYHLCVKLSEPNPNDSPKE